MSKARKPSPGVEFEYPIPAEALERWARENLTLVSREDGAFHYRFRYEGSTCTGQRPLIADLHAVVRPGPGGLLFEKGWIEMSGPKAAMNQFCGVIQSGPEYLEFLRRPAADCGRTVEEIVSDFAALSPAGCLCDQPSINHKWRMALFTIHYARARNLVVDAGRDS
jgi:hypothetical protein